MPRGLLRLLSLGIDHLRLRRGGPDTRTPREIINAMGDAEHLRPAELELLTEPEAKCAEANAGLRDAALVARDDRSEATQRQLFEAVVGWQELCGPYRPSKDRERIARLRQRLARFDDQSTAELGNSTN